MFLDPSDYISDAIRRPRLCHSLDILSERTHPSFYSPHHLGILFAFIAYPLLYIRKPRSLFTASLTWIFHHSGPIHTSPRPNIHSCHPRTLLYLGPSISGIGHTFLMFAVLRKHRY